MVWIAHEMHAKCALRRTLALRSSIGCRDWRTTSARTAGASWGQSTVRMELMKSVCTTSNRRQERGRRRICWYSVGTGGGMGRTVRAGQKGPTKGPLLGGRGGPPGFAAQRPSLSLHCCHFRLLCAEQRAGLQPARPALRRVQSTLRGKERRCQRRPPRSRQAQERPTPSQLNLTLHWPG